MHSLSHLFITNRRVLPLPFVRNQSWTEIEDYQRNGNLDSDSLSKGIKGGANGMEHTCNSK